MASAKIKGLRETKNLSHEGAITLKQMKFGNPSKNVKPMPNDTSVAVGDWQGTLSDIAWIDLNQEERTSDQKKSNLSQDYRTEYAKYCEHIRNMRRLSPEQKAKNLDMAKMVWFSCDQTGDMPEDLVNTIIERQLLNLKENPNSCYANPVCYRDLIQNRSTGKLESVSDHLKVTSLMFIDRVISASARVE